MRYVKVPTAKSGDTIRVTIGSEFVVELNGRRLARDEYEIRDDAIEQSGWKEGVTFHWSDATT